MRACEPVGFCVKKIPRQISIWLSSSTTRPGRRKFSIPEFRRGNNRISRGWVVVPRVMAGHPRFCCWRQEKSWVAGPSPAMTQEIAMRRLKHLFFRRPRDPRGSATIYPREYSACRQILPPGTIPMLCLPRSSGYCPVICFAAAIILSTNLACRIEQTCI